MSHDEREDLVRELRRELGLGGGEGRDKSLQVWVMMVFKNDNGDSFKFLIF